MNKSIILPAMFAIIILAFIPRSVLADGIIIPEPPECDPCPFPSPMSQLEIRYHHVTVTIEDQIATTHVDQVFYNPNDWVVEGVYVFPIPVDAAVNDFLLWMDGEPVEGELLEAEQARQMYEDIVMTLKDPALLEYAGRGALQASIFPIPPEGERRIELEYTQVLAADNGLVRYIYPLNTEKFSAIPLEEVSIHVEIHSQELLRAVYSPSHPIAVDRENDFFARAGYEAQEALPDRDFALYYSIGKTEAFHLLTYRDPDHAEDPDGFFLLLLAPGIRERVEGAPKDVILVLDRSGSMDGEKFRQAQEALRFILGNLNPGDRFNLITFSTGVESYSQRLVPADEAAEALPWVDGQRAEGSTDIQRALLEASSFVDGDRPAYLIFLTDGLPTEGVTDSQKILDDFSQAAPANLSLFAFGVGYDVDTFLLDSLAQSHHGSSTYVLPGEPLDEILSAFYTRIGTPVLTALSLDFGSMPVYDLYPDPLPDLFLGSQVVLLGRYREGGSADIKLSGRVGEANQVFDFPEQRFARGGDEVEVATDSIPRLWATRKIGYLLNQIRLHGPEEEIIDQIVRLSIRYGIITPYTSYLVTEPLPLGEVELQRLAADEFDDLQAQPAAPSSGQEAVEKAAGQEALAGAESLIEPSVDLVSRVRTIGARTFVFEDGVWTDTAYNPDEMAVRKVAFLSDEYFQLAQSNPDLAQAFSLGQEIVGVVDGIAYHVVVESDTEIDPVETATPDPAQEEQQTTPRVNEATLEPNSDEVSSVTCVNGLIAPITFLLFGIVWWKTRGFRLHSA